MTALADTLHEVGRVLGDAVVSVFDEGTLRALDDGSLLSVIAQAAAIARQAEALLIEAVAQVNDRVDAAPPADRMTTVHGCRSVKELVQRVTRQSSRTVGDLVRAGRAVGQPVSVVSGKVLPAEYPAMRAALASGAVGLDGVVAVVGALAGAGCAPDARRAAEYVRSSDARAGG